MKELFRLIGITGGIGAGKSVVSRVLRLKGYAVYDCDEEAKRLMIESNSLRDNLINRFGDECIIDGTLNKSFIATRIFNDSEARGWLNRQVHGAVASDIDEWCKGKGLAFVESAILHTSGLDKKCDEIWLVVAPEETRIARALKRGGIEEDNLRKRIEAQKDEFDSLPQDITRELRNDGCGLLKQIELALNDINKSINTN